MRVVQMMAGAEMGGAETYFVTQTLSLQRAGLDQKVVVRPHPARVAQLLAGGCEVSTAAFGGRLDLRTHIRLRRMLAAWAPDVVLTWMSRASRACPPGQYVRAARLGGYYDPKYYRGFDHLIGITPDIVEWLAARGWPRERLHHIPNFCRVDDVPAADRAAVGTPDDVPLLLALGRLHPAKALDVLLHALVSVPRAHLWIAGEGPLRGELEALAAALGLAERVRFLGWRSDRSALLGAADLCVFPSRYEPNGTVTVEAWAHRVPLVAAASDGPRQQVRDGVDGLLAPIDDADALSAAIRRVLAEPELARSLVEAGAAHAAAEFSEAAVTARYLSFFQAVSPN